jgi:cytochrome c553
MRRANVVGFILLAGTALAGPPAGEGPPVGGSQAGEAGVTTVAESPAAEPRIVAMHRQLGIVQRMHDAVVDGDFAQARETATKLAEPRDIADMPEAWRPWLVVMRESAKRASGDWSHQDAARTVTEVGRSCGGCHAFTGGGPPDSAGDPPEGFGRHGWAAKAMWVSLIRGDEGGFRASGEVLRGADLGKVSKKEAAVFRQLATRATHAQSRAVMADTYGELLGTCAGCHDRLRD